MPELPEVETVARTLEHLIMGKEIVQATVYWPKIIKQPVSEFQQRVAHQHIGAFLRRGKAVEIQLDQGILSFHLRMEGKCYVYDKATPCDKHTHLILDFADGSQLHYHDVRKFGRWLALLPGQENPLTANMGPEPFDVNLTGLDLYQKAKGKSQSIKAFLLDQSNLAGIGNIYANEILFACKIKPSRRVSKITRKQWQKLLEKTREILKEAIKQGGTTIRSYTSSLGVTGRFQQSLCVHGKSGEACPHCGALIVRSVVAGRGTYHCPGCQK
ncbi:MAG: bifunctional DNA-formamidopyrimidine glycosylase/DNA-(apurinic or apyrimidinic site) lyase [Erysipelotrichaceae bacterium]|jgi:formamidopyrimidine-DNA glycosylase|nr:bifunctional DNA-formamidopyrimidine glycosylase/DNA-(apurinic or apyrimidinic site) lyase [Erysipelotrichaceae bacterium]